MKIHLMSDVHLEFDPSFTPPYVDADITVLAGDIGYGIEGIEWAKKRFSRPVVYVLGNHEYYPRGWTLETVNAAAKNAAAGT